MSNTPVPVVVLDPGGISVACVACGEPIHADEERFVLVEDPARRKTLAPSAHQARFVDDDSYDVDDPCRRALRRMWEARLAEHDACVLSLVADGGGKRFFAGDVALHAGTPLDAMLGDGRWLCGRFEYVPGERPLANLWLSLGGFDPGQSPLGLPIDTVVRIPKR